MKMNLTSPYLPISLMFESQKVPPYFSNNIFYFYFLELARKTKNTYFAGATSVIFQKLLFEVPFLWDKIAIFPT